MKIKKLEVSSYFIFFVVLYCFYTYDLRPYFFWDTYETGVLGIINRLPIRSMIGLMIIVLGIINTTSINSIRSMAFAIIVPVVIGFSLIINRNYAFSPNWILPFATMFYLLAPPAVKEKSYIYFYDVFLLLLIVPIIIYVLVHLGIDMPYRTLESHEDVKQSMELYYRIYPLACQWTDSWNEAYRALRLCGVYSEPGVVGTFCAMLLCAESFQLRKKWKNIVILVGGILSFSLAFYIIIFVYIFWRMMRVNWKYGTALLGVVVVYVIFINIHFDNPTISNFQSRLIITSEGLSGNNRTNSRYDAIFGDLANSGIFGILFGRGFGAIEDILAAKGIDGASYKNLLYNYGVIGFAIQIIWYFAVTLSITRRRNKQYRRFCLGMCLIMCANMYQRPSMFGFQYLIVMFGADYCHMNHIQASMVPIFSRRAIRKQIGGIDGAGHQIRIPASRR